MVIGPGISEPAHMLVVCQSEEDLNEEEAVQRVADRGGGEENAGDPYLAGPYREIRFRSSFSDRSPKGITLSTTSDGARALWA